MATTESSPSVSTSDRRGFLDSAWPYVISGGLLTLLSAAIAMGGVFLLLAGGAAIIGGLILVGIGCLLGYQGIRVIGHGLALRSGRVVHQGRGPSKFDSEDWKLFWTSLGAIVGLGIVLILLAVTILPAVGLLIPAAAIAGFVMTGFAHSDYLQEVRGVPKRPAAVTGWVAAIFMAASVVLLVIGAANAIRLDTKYDL